MGILLEQSLELDGQEYSLVFLTLMSVEQVVSTLATVMPVYSVTLRWRLFRMVNNTGERVFHPDEFEAVFPHFLQMAVENVVNGDMIDITMFKTVEMAIANMIAKQTGTSVTVV